MDDEEEDYSDFDPGEEENSDLEAEGGYEQLVFQEIIEENEGPEEEKPVEESLTDKLYDELASITELLSKNEIDFKQYNSKLIGIQMQMYEEKLKELDKFENKLIVDQLQTEVNAFFDQLGRQREKQKFNPRKTQNTIDDIFRKYSQILEHESQTFEFESNPISSNIANIVNLPTPEKYIKTREKFQKKIENQTLRIEDIYEYLRVNKQILLDKLDSFFKDDILYSRFKKDVITLFDNLNSELTYMVGNSHIVLDDQISSLNQKLDIGHLTSRLQILRSVDLLEQIYQSKINALIKSYTHAKKALFTKEESAEVLKVMNQLKAQYTTTSTGKFQRKFTDNEITDDFKNQDLKFIIEKYGKYIESDYFEWSKAKAQEKVETKEPKFKKKKFTKKELSTLEDFEAKEYQTRKDFLNILSKIPKFILLNCAHDLKITEPRATFTKQEQYINELYENSIPILYYSVNPPSVTDYATAVGKLTDEFYLNKSILESEWNMGTHLLAVGDKVTIDRRTQLIKKLQSKILRITKQIEKNTGVVYGSGGSSDLKFKNELEKLHTKKVIQYLNKELESANHQLDIYNKSYLRPPETTGTVAKMYNDKDGNHLVDVILHKSGTVQTVSREYVLGGSLGNKLGPVCITITSMKPTSIQGITQWIKRVLGIKDLYITDKEWEEFKQVNYVIASQESLIRENLSKQKIIRLYDEALIEYNKLSEKEREKLPVPDKGPLMYKYPPQEPEDEKDDRMEYAKKMGEYLREVQQNPAINPNITISTPVPNQLIPQIQDQVFPDLITALENTPVNGFFKINRNGCTIIQFEKMVLQHLTESEKKIFRRHLLTSAEINEFEESLPAQKPTSSSENASHQPELHPRDPCFNPKEGMEKLPNLCFPPNLPNLTTILKHTSSLDCEQLTNIDRLKYVDLHSDKFTELLNQILGVIGGNIDFKVVGDKILVQGEEMTCDELRKKLIKLSLKTLPTTAPSAAVQQPHVIDKYIAAISWALTWNSNIPTLGCLKKCSKFPSCLR